MKLQLKSELNEKQYIAASTIQGPVLIIAGAGSGKTRMITFRIAHMLELGIPQSSILALTFTNKAAKEMSERICDLTGKKLQQLTSSTFHAFGVKILRSEIQHMGYDQNFSIYDQADKQSLIKNIIRELGIPLEDVDLYELNNLFSAIKTGRAHWDHDTRKYQHIYDEYLLHLKAYNAVDFDDLITMPIQLFKTHPEILKKYRQRYEYIMVDEFQDTSLAQYTFVHLLAQEHRNICVVGDDDQSIYSWRGANYENLLNFERDYPEVVEIKLEQNYRSTGNILHAANTVIANNTKRKAKELWTGLDKGSTIALFHPEDEEQEAEFIANKIKELSLKHQLSYDSFGVLVRTNNLLPMLEQTLMDQQIPYTISGGKSFFQRKEIKDLIAYMRLLTNPDDDINFLRIINTPRRGIGRVSLEFLRSFAKAHHMSLYSAVAHLGHHDHPEVRERLRQTCLQFAELIEEFRTRILSRRQMTKTLWALVGEIEYRDHLISEHPDNDRLVQWKMKSIELFLDMFERWELDPDNLDPNIYDYLNRITLTTKDDTDKEKGKVNLMTIHASKGLEFHTVFLAGVEDHIIPHARAINEDEHNIEEERRLFYVAITRAQRSLFITSCKQRKVMREVIDTVPSRFLEEIPKDLLAQTDADTVATEDEAVDYFALMRARLSKDTSSQFGKSSS